VGYVTRRAGDSNEAARLQEQRLLRGDFLELVDEAIDGRDLIWFGTRAEDGLPLLRLGDLRSCYGATGPAEVDGLGGTTLEQLSGRRVDLDRWDIDEDRSKEVRELRRWLLAESSAPSVVVGYRPSRFLSAVGFAHMGLVHIAAMFHEQQVPFEHKPWVESQLEAIGVPVIPWRYIADEDIADAVRSLREGPLMLRPSKGSGGVGLARVTDEESLRRHWPANAEAFVSVAPFIDDAVPLNVTATCGGGSAPSIHAASVQLIGLPQCTDRTFAYCGNDYGAARVLPAAVLDEVERICQVAGAWIAGRGFVGAYGVDLLVQGRKVWFGELNARFQGGSVLSAAVDDSLGLPDVYAEHLAAHLGVARPARPPLREQMIVVPPAAHVVVHNTGGEALQRYEALFSAPRGLTDINMVPAREVAVEPGGVLFRMVFDREVTRTGMALEQDVTVACRDLTESFGAVGNMNQVGTTNGG